MVKKEKREVLNKTTKPMVKTISLEVEVFRNFCFSTLKNDETALSSYIYVDPFSGNKNN